MIKIESGDTIIDILKKVSYDTWDTITLDFSFGHPVLHNYLSLKVLKAKCWEKPLVIISNDVTSRRIWKKLWIKYIKNKSKQEHSLPWGKKNLLQENYSFWEYALFEIKRYKNTLTWSIKQNKRFNSLHYRNSKTKTLDKNIFIIFILMFIVVLLLFLYIYYFAINKTIVTITPEILVNTKARNITYYEKLTWTWAELNQSMLSVPIEKISHTHSITKNIAASWIKQESLNSSSGKVLFTNFFQEDVSLLKNTTFRNKDNVNFYINSDIIIPPAIKEEESWKIIPWTLEWVLYSKIELTWWKYIWDASNIKAWETLIIPKLEKDKSKLFAKTITDFSWATNNYTKYITETDIKEAKVLVQESLKDESISTLNKKIALLNENNNIKKTVLSLDNIYKYSPVSFSLWEHIVDWFEQDSFSITATLTVTTYIYNKDHTIALLSKVINDTSVAQLERINSIDGSSLRTSHVIARNDLKQWNDWKYSYITLPDNEPLKIKATTEIEYYSSKQFSALSNSFLEKIKYQITDIPTYDAQKILLNNSDINNVSIKVAPFFLKNTSKTAQNIEFKLHKNN